MGELVAVLTLGVHQPQLIRGGSWGVPAQPFARATHRYAPELFAIDNCDTDWHTGYDVGFRCAKDAR